MRNYFYDNLVSFPADDYSSFASRSRRAPTGVMRDGQIDEGMRDILPFGELKSRAEEPWEYAQDATKNALSSFGVDGRTAELISEGAGKLVYLSPFQQAYDTGHLIGEANQHFGEGEFGSGLLNSGLALAAMTPAGKIANKPLHELEDVVANNYRKPNMRPFYGEDVGPKGQIVDPEQKSKYLLLTGGIAGDPRNGFFNPATSALLQEGVQPRQTVAYYKKQMGSRGGKLPEGYWETMANRYGWKPNDVVDRDKVVQLIDEMTPEFLKHDYYKDKSDISNYRTSRFDTPKYEDYISYKDPEYKKNYAETVIGYPANNNSSIPINRFRDNHFEHPNLEGWMRTNDLGTGRVLEEVQPQRYQKGREKGFRNEIEYKNLQAKEKQLVDEWYNTSLKDPRFEEIRNEIDSIQKTLLNEARKPAPSPYTQDVNAATDLILKNAIVDASKENKNFLAWTHGDAQAKRYDQLLQNVGIIDYNPKSKILAILDKDGNRLYRDHTENIADVIGKDAANKVLSTPINEHGYIAVDFPDGITVGGEGMKSYYGSGPTGEGGILTDRILSNIERVTGERPSINPVNIKRNLNYPSVKLSDEFKEKVKKIGLPIFSTIPFLANEYDEQPQNSLSY